MTSSDLLRLRLDNQQLTRNSFTNITTMAAYLGALQAQDYAGAKWSVAMRMGNTTDAEVEQAIVEKKIVRTWAMRGTWHFIAPADVRMVLDVVRPRLVNGFASTYRKLGLDEKQLMKSQALIVSALKNEKQITRSELHTLLDKSGLLPNGLRFNHILLRAALDGLICQGPRKGKEFTFVLLDEWIPAAKPAAREKAIAELAARFFTSHGPATLKDFSGWLGITGSEAKAAIEACSAKLARHQINEKEYWMAKGRDAVNEVARALLIHGFDEYLLGYKDRSEALDPAYSNRVIGAGNGLYSPTVLIDGRVAGTWKRTIGKSEVIIEIQPFIKFTKVQKIEVEKEAGRYAQFLGLKPKLL